MTFSDDGSTSRRIDLKSHETTERAAT